MGTIKDLKKLAITTPTAFDCDEANRVPAQVDKKALSWKIEGIVGADDTKIQSCLGSSWPILSSTSLAES